MFYAIRHFTRYRYSKPVSQSSMEVRMHPRSEYSQRCFTFQLSVSPRARIFSYYDHTGNVIHHFDIPEQHRQLTIIADALVDVDPPLDLPEALENDSWRQLDEMIAARRLLGHADAESVCAQLPAARKFRAQTRGG